jgi:hypothetical protein
MFHPLHQILYRVFPLAVAFNLELLASYVAAFAGMFWLMRRLGFDRTAALFAAMLFAFSGFLILHLNHVNLVAVIAHLPWLLAAADLLLTASTRPMRAAGFAAVAAIVTSEILLGFPQAVLFTLIALGGFITARVFETRQIARALLVPCAAATGGLMGALQWMPTADVADRSIRTLYPSDFALSFSLHPANLLQLVSPYLFSSRVFTTTDVPLLHEFGLYSGAFLVVAPFWLWIRRADLGGRRVLAFGTAVAAVGALVLALGRYGGVATVITMLPRVQWTRASARYLVLVQFALIVLATIAFDDLRAMDATTRRPRRSWIVWIPAGLSVAITLLISTRWVPIFEKAVLAPLPHAAAGTLCVIVVTALAVLAGRGVPFALAALVVVTAVDLGWSGVWTLYDFSPRSIGSLTEGMPKPSDTPGGGRLYVDVGGNLGNLPLLDGFRLSSGYVALEPATYFGYSTAAALRLSGTRWMWVPLTGALTRIDGPLDRARMIAVVEVMRSLKGRNVGRVALDARGIDVHEFALVDRAIPPLQGPPGRVRVVVDRPGQIELETNATGRQLLALTERFDPGWHASSDRQPVEIVRVHGDFLGAVVEAGQHRVEFRFMPISFVEGVRLSGLGAALLGLEVLAVAGSGRRWRFAGGVGRT